MNNMIETWLQQQGVEASYLPIINLFIGCVLILIISSLSYYITRYHVLKSINLVIAKTQNSWDDLFVEHCVFIRAIGILPFIVILFFTPLLLPPTSLLAYIFILTAKVAICFQVANTINSALNVVKSLYRQTARERYIPLNSAIQMLKLAVYLVAVILAISYIIGRSPLYLLSGLGALTAVLILVFQDTIKGLVASIQISANRMLAPGDWVEIPQYGADGDVIEIGLSSVKIQNFDKTITTVPTYALISGSFKNWRDMFDSGGRRIKRAIIIDVASIGFCDKNQIDSFKKITLLKDYLAQKTADISQSNINKQADENDLLNARQLTNIGTFRAYIEAYLHQHDKVHQELTCMVRQLPTTATGLPLELYFFSNDQDWANYEGIQADIFDHLFAMAPQFNLRIFQHPTGHDWSNKN